MMRRVLTVMGTRPEAIKLAPVILALRRDAAADVTIVATEQHTTMLQQMLDVFAIKADYRLGVMREGQTLTDIATAVLRELDPILTRVRPDVVLVQGDTTSAFAAALAAFHARVPVAHLEAGLRTGARYDPFPEEMNRRVLTALATWHFAPTEASRESLLREGVAPDRIVTTGNTIVDALAMVRDRARAAAGALPCWPPQDTPLLLATLHRRESFGETLRGFGLALRRICGLAPHVRLVLPVHLNPEVQATLHAGLAGVPNAHLVPPLGYLEMVGLLERAYLVLTDSGGIQEEAATLGCPALVLRKTTERREGIEAGVATLVGTEPEAIVATAMALVRDPAARERMARPSGCYGDGHAAARVAVVLASGALA